MSDTLNHLNAQGQVHMVNIGTKDVTERRATARAYVTMLPTTLRHIQEGLHHKGDVLATARIAGIQAAKKCADLIPLCHPLLITHVEVELRPQAEFNRVEILATVGLAGKTGVEMEALTAASIAALTIYDMCKAVDKGMVISETRLLAKSGGRSGDWVYQDPTTDIAP